MTKFVVREVYEGEEAARNKIVDMATTELRRIYIPRENGGLCGGMSSTVLVALKGSGVVGTAEYILKGRHIYIQGVAVHTEYRSRGVCRALLCSIEEIAKTEGVQVLCLCVIEETGNVAIFRNLGFKVVNCATAVNHVSPLGNPVTQVDMEKKIA